MQIETLSCNNCGAPLQVPANTNYVTCAHCNSRLAVKRTDTAHYTEVIERLEQRTNKIDEQVHRLQVENDLLRLEQDWEQEKRDYMVKTKDGGLVEPSMGNAIGASVGALVVVLAGCFLLVPSTSSSGDSSLNALYFIVMLVVGGLSVYAAVDGYMKYQAYKQAESDYYVRRSEVESRRNRNLLSDL